MIENPRNTGPGAACWCGCGDRIPEGKRPQARYVDSRHARAAQTAREHAEAGTDPVEGVQVHGGLVGRLYRALRDLRGPYFTAAVVRWEWRDWYLNLWAPVTVTRTTDPDSSLFEVSLPWSRCGLWTFPDRAACEAMNLSGPLVWGFAFGPVDLRRPRRPF